MHLLTTPSTLLGFLIVVLSIILSVTVMKFVARRVSYASLKENYEIADSVFAMLGGLYSVLLAFMLVISWQQYSDTGTNAEQEALRVSTLMRDSRAFGTDTQNLVRERLIEYTKAVIEDEWKTMPGGQVSQVTIEAYERVWDAYYSLQPETEREKAFYKTSLDRLNELSVLRRHRILDSRAGIPALLWILLIVGGIIVVAFTYLFGSKSGITQTLVVIALSGFISFNLFLILAFDYPYSGVLGIKPDAFQSVIQTWGR